MEQAQAATETGNQSVTEAQQKQLHADTVGKLAQLFAEISGETTFITAMNIAIDFTVATLIYIFKSAGALDKLSGRVIGDEVARRINELKKVTQ